ncbi:MAG: sulfurtransferase [Candidatus Tectimicrobiota bacterium]
MPRRPDRQIVVSVDWLAAHLHDTHLRIMDARIVPPTETHPQGDAAYAAGHIPGAVFVHWRQDLSINTPPVPNLLLEAEPFAAKMGQFGVDDSTTVIVYDPGDENWAARLWWALKYYGHDQVYVLQGGAAAWQEAGQPWTTEVVQPQPSTFVARPRPAMRATKARVLQAVHDPATTIIETRRQQNIAAAGGTVQGAFWLPSTTVYASQGTYRDLISEEELDRYLQEIGADRAASLVAT